MHPQSLIHAQRTGFGGARLDEHPDQATTTVHRALDRQVNFIDTARVYPDSEQYLGVALKGRRSQVVLATKAAIETPDRTQQILEKSLTVLQVDSVDLLYAHACDTEGRFLATRSCPEVGKSASPG